MEKTLAAKTAAGKAIPTKILLLGAAGCAAVALSIGGAGRSSGGAQPTAALTPTGTPVAIATGDSCDSDSAVPSRVDNAFVHGRLSGALSTGKVLVGGDGQVFASFDLETFEDAGKGKRAPVDVALVVDRSGSMSGEKIEHARRAAQGLIDRLGKADRVSLVQYDDSAQVVVPLTALTPQGRTTLQQAIRRLSPGGGTNLHAGMVLGRDQLNKAMGEGRVNRVILLSDGLANEGVTDPHALGDVAKRAAEKGVRLSTVGVGQDYAEDLMELLAEHGRGRYHYVAKPTDLEGILAAELSTLKSTVARKTELRLQPACDGVEIAEVFGYEFKRDGHAVVVPMTDLFAGDKRRVLVRLRVPSNGSGHQVLVTGTLSYSAVSDGKTVQSHVALGAQMSTDVVAVEAAADKDIVAAALEVTTAAALQNAARAYEKGDRDSARRFLHEAKSEVAVQQKRYQLAPAQAEDALMDVDEFEEEIAAYAPSSNRGKHALKYRKARSRKKMKMAAKYVK